MLSGQRFAIHAMFSSNLLIHKSVKYQITCSLYKDQKQTINDQAPQVQIYSSGELCLPLCYGDIFVCDSAGNIVSLMPKCETSQ